jgi:glycosyltransferase involved in cell wall biosynthesis
VTDGENGLLVQPKIPRELADKIPGCLMNGNRKTSGRQWSFSSAVIFGGKHGQKTEEVYEGMLRR